MVLWLVLVLGWMPLEAPVFEDSPFVIVIVVRRRVEWDGRKLFD